MRMTAKAMKARLVELEEAYRVCFENREKASLESAQWRTQYLQASSQIEQCHSVLDSLSDAPAKGGVMHANQLVTRLSIYVIRNGQS